jgi:hypothetical protein
MPLSLFNEVVKIFIYILLIDDRVDLDADTANFWESVSDRFKTSLQKNSRR